MDQEAVSVPLHSTFPDAGNFESSTDVNVSSDDPFKLVQARSESTKGKPNRAFRWSRRITITSEPLWLAKVRRHKVRTTLLVFFPSVLIFLLAFFLAPPRPHASNNNLKFYLGGLFKPDMIFTAAVVPKRFHSHEDYKQEIPLLAALSYGATSVEVAVWEQDGNLLVGDSSSSLSDTKTLDSVYLKPLNWLLSVSNKDNNGTVKNGVFEAAPQMPLQLLVDIRTNGTSAYNLLYQTLQPFYKQGYLTTYNTSDPNSGMNYSAVTVVGTGSTPYSSVLAGVAGDPVRYIFFDAPLNNLGQNNYTMTDSPMASAPWDSTIGSRWIVPSLAKRKISSYLDEAHSRGIQARFYGTPSIPKWARNEIWQMLLDTGADWLDVDDLCAAGDY